MMTQIHSSHIQQKQSKNVAAGKTTAPLRNASRHPSVLLNHFHFEYVRSQAGDCQFIVLFLLISDDFEFICQSSEKVVPEWDTDLNLRLKQLDSVLANAAKTANSSKSANLTTSEDSNQAGTKRYSCPQCPGTFNSCAARSSHRRKVHERFYMCHECDMAFGSSQKLERHMKTHSGIKEFRCETCGKEFMIERNLVKQNS